MSPLFICYVRGTNLLAQYEFNYGASDDYTYYLQNAHGDVTALLDTAGKLTKSYVYDAFGVEQNIDNSDSNAFRYCGEYYDAETGTVYLRARYYNPVTGRFISRDSYTGEHDDPLSLNLYTYCHNNPIVAVDPSGHIFMLVTAAIGAVAGAVVGGCVAAANGESVLKGALIGGAVGGVVGLGAGALAAGALAGSFTASTSAVVLGASNFGATVATGGLTAGAGYLASNLNSSVNNVIQTASSAINHVASRFRSLIQGKNTPLYRGERSSVTPDQVFQNGFTPKGEHNNLLQHVTSNTTPGNYISTSQSFDIAQQFAGRNGYVYEIYSKTAINVNNALGSLSPFPEQLEYAIPGKVSGEMVKGAYVLCKGALTGEYIPNPFFGG